MGLIELLVAAAPVGLSRLELSMERSSVLRICLSWCLLATSIPLPLHNSEFETSRNLLKEVVPEDNRTVGEMIEKANKDPQHPLFEGDERFRLGRSARECSTCLWPKSFNGTVNVPYIISPVFTNFEKSLFVMAMKEFETMTCVKFVYRTTEYDYVNIENQANCWSYIGRLGGMQSLGLNMPNCIKYNLIQHELMHALGFYHEHTRRDRDNYIEVMWQNIPPVHHLLFKLDDGNIQNMPYDYSSIMHYSNYVYSKEPGLPSMVPKPDPSVAVGQSIGLVDMDIRKINSLYNCDLCRKKLFAPGSFVFDSSSSETIVETCFYLIQSTYKVLLQLAEINLPSSPDCIHGYIKIYDGVSTSSPVFLKKTCGKVVVPPLTSSGNLILIEIGKTQPFARMRFIAIYETVKYGATIMTENEILSSPGFPSFYPNNANLYYSIVAPVGNRVSLNFTFFKMPPSPMCFVDHLTIYDGPAINSQVLGTFCGAVAAPTSFISTGNVVVLHFQSGDTKGYNGFIADYKFVNSR
ncbi:hypothetical protein GDO81_007106 [Engystomops pustulosus]|uniref:Metalloendopeptidase n=1 Tax=Engystomops pustulosus TaxID=76066 RepID=A0AAV7C519_ENGPU|nr:hypothetical protein GDO81_007106 [Engystomops pustulosus]